MTFYFAILIIKFEKIAYLFILRQSRNVKLSKSVCFILVRRPTTWEKSRKNDQTVINKCHYAKTIKYF